VDHYSDFWEIDQLDDTTSKAIVDKLMVLFSRYGIPDTFISDNGPQFTGLPMISFAKEWSFRHVTSSPRYPRSNGKAESAVKIAKSILTKCKADGSNVWLAILNWRNTPTESVGSSPSQRLMSRRTRTCLPTASKTLRPRVITGVQHKLTNKRCAAKKHYDRGTKELSELSIGQPVRIRLHTGRNKKWTEGKCLGQVAPRSYDVQTKYGTFRRNRQMIQVAPDLENYCVTPSTYVDESTTNIDPPKNEEPENYSQLPASVSDDPVTDQEPSSDGSSPELDNVQSKPSPIDVAVTSGSLLPRRSRSGRIIQPPIRYRHDLQ